MESKNWSSCGYFNPDFSPGKPVSLRIWTPLDLNPPAKSASRYVPPGPNPLADIYPPVQIRWRIWPPQQNWVKTSSLTF